MWKRIQKRLQKKQTDGEDRTENKQVITNRRIARRNLDIKVAYQYPRRTPFRFPVIPDQVDQKYNHIDEPTFKRRSKRMEDQVSVPKKSTSNHSFTPSEVASPIYGFQRRKSMREVANTPAYERKQSDRNNLETKTSREQNVQMTRKQFHHPSEEDNEKRTPSLNKHRNKVEEEFSSTIQQNGIELDEKPFKSRSNKAQSKIVPFTKDENIEKPYPDENNFQETGLQREAQNHHEEAIPLHLLNDPVKNNYEDHQWMKEQQSLLEETLHQFNVPAKVVHVTQGPTVTRFEVQPELGVKVSRVRNLSDDIKMNLAAKDIRIEAPIPGKNTIGIEVPNLNAQMVGLQEILQTDSFDHNRSPLTIGLGLSIEGEPHITTIDQMPHGLIAGATGSGKSVCINTILMSLLYKTSHEDVKLLLIDPKMVELAPYNEIPHLISPVITDIKAATAALKWAVDEMEERYEQFVQAGVRDIHRFNEKMPKQMPHIVIVIDELSDLMMASPQDVEDAICRIAQKARACGMHLILATQRPSVDVITGLIKANIPTRIAFSVSSQVDSRTIMDTNGAEQLLGKGDMLFIENGSGKSVRLQGAFVSDDEIERVTNYVKTLAKPHYLFQQDQLLQDIEEDEETDELFEDVIQFILEQDQASTSLLQRKFRIGYNRAARLIDTLESKGMISDQKGSKPRDVLFTLDQLEEYI